MRSITVFAEKCGEVRHNAAMPIDTDETVKVTVLMPKEEFARFDAFCRGRGYKKSPLLARLVRELLDSEGYDIQGELPL